LLEDRLRRWIGFIDNQQRWANNNCDGLGKFGWCKQ
jgi:hypothetical protein